MPSHSLALLTVLAAHGCFYNPEGTLVLPGETTGYDTTDPTATTTLTPGDKPACGNEVLEPGEQCDDGNATPGDGCEPDCTTTPGELCGNGTVDDGEECDDGNNVAMDGCENNCTKTVIPASCGDGKTDAGEECDDGNDDNTDACTNTCKSAVCGDGVILAGTEECDDGAPSASCDGDCTAVECGDGVVNAEAGEECEDENSDNSDTCVSCKIAFCGDGFVQVGAEECDDGTPAGDDLCNSCKINPSRHIFITTSVFSGDRNGIAGADGDCVDAANAGNIPNAGDVAWTAWLSSGSNQAAERLDQTFTGWYVLPTNPPTLVAKGWAGLTSGQLMHAIDHTENGEAVPEPLTAWTNTHIAGDLPALNLNCSNWNSMDGGASGRVGLSSATDKSWTDPAEPASAPCNTQHHLYCVENLP
ncbi:DUF4215 domain-containing protein [Nannocystis sp. RBIL2]|uniref:DUF4215 domain-containing protein n=1 Tax=Nannocystis sp. RBIL2 TaxID=2996788 RepID=UPI00226D76BE|nr:DUF4215 domain-containing protein [Nannocystis sp. RBIL2]MCY1071144.1 DUF4215 domain-containing protein [Nannocystis sp. RBIL2]